MSANISCYFIEAISDWCSNILYHFSFTKIVSWAWRCHLRAFNFTLAYHLLLELDLHPGIYVRSHTLCTEDYLLLFIPWEMCSAVILAPWNSWLGLLSSFCQWRPSWIFPQGKSKHYLYWFRILTGHLTQVIFKNEKNLNCKRISVRSLCRFYFIQVLFWRGSKMSSRA